jgi:hypothetical protein
VSTSTRTRADAASVDPDDTAAVDADPTTPAADTTSEPSWVDRCQRQFAPETTRLPNLADDENRAMHDGV